MNTKLTLSINQRVITNAKLYARNRKKSLSNIIEDYLKSLSIAQKEDINHIPPVTKSLAGILKGKPEINFPSEIVSYLEKKYK